MKALKNKLPAIIICTYVLITGAGCKKTFDINHDPNNPSLEVGTPKIVFPVSVMGVAAAEGGQLAIIGGIFGEYLSQAATTSQYKDVAQYDLKATDYNQQYTILFTYGLKNLQFVIDKANESKDWNFYLMGNVMKAYATGLLVDLYDKIPYSQALEGIGNLTPKFDSGYEIYESLIAGIDTALGKDFSAQSAIDLRSTHEGNVDLLFGGDISKWKAFANTLELKFYLRMINAKPEEAKAGIEALYARNATFLSEDAKIDEFVDIPSQSNPLYEQNIRQLNTDANLVASKTFLSYLQSNNDPRAADLFGPNPVGLDQGDFLNPSQAALAASKYKEKATDPVVFLSAAESYFMQSEARIRYFSGSGAKTLYDKGVLSSFSEFGEDASSYIAPGGAYQYPDGSSAENLHATLMQEWASFAYGVHFIEGWFEKNRTGIPESSPVYSTDPSYIPGQFVVSKNSVLPPGKYPKRLVFPDVEASRNPNTPTPVPVTTPVWWGL